LRNTAGIGLFDAKKNQPVSAFSALKFFSEPSEMEQMKMTMRDGFPAKEPCSYLNSL
jgi:hypothetical protein